MKNYFRCAVKTSGWSFYGHKITAILVLPMLLTCAGWIAPIMLSPESSPIVNRGADGVPTVMMKNGAPVNGLKLSQYDAVINSPNLVVASDNTIHLAFIERQVGSPFTLFVFHRQSTDGGKTWSEPKNLSEDMPNITVGNCEMLVDGQNRVYVIWRTGLGENWPPREGQCINLVYRVLDHGKWSKVLNAHPPGTDKTQNVGAIFPFAVTDAAGHAQIVWNACPDTYRPETTLNGSHLWGIGNGLVFQATLDGTTPPTPRQIFMAKVAVDPAQGGYGKSCDDLSALDGYVDAAGAAHFIAITRSILHPVSGSSSQINLFEKGGETPALKLPSPEMEIWSQQPRLLVDAKGRRHVIAFYNAGEHPSFRDYLIGSDDEPTVILAPKIAGATCLGFQAYQGPGGNMAVVMQTTERGYDDSGDSWVSVSDGTKWSPSVCVTANAARASFVAKNKGARLTVGTGDHYGPGPGAVAFDKQGHLLLALINNKTGSFALSSGGVVYSGGSSRSPMLFFYKF